MIAVAISKRIVDFLCENQLKTEAKKIPYFEK